MKVISKNDSKTKKACGNVPPEEDAGGIYLKEIGREKIRPEGFPL
jgi:hypothetical protein